ncbi:MAG: hypothetical protein JWM21_2424 [Acidobacteria bacterium]|nr:hypothetical protein [Acidobacteriota bacterium]
MVSTGVGSFTKQAACPSSKILLEYRRNTLAPELSKLVEWHLEECDFCWSEMRLLTHHAPQAASKEEGRPPSMPVNLRVLAEALLFSHRPRPTRQKKQAKQ